MRIVNLNEEKSCSFCAKSHKTARWLIESPDHRAWICDECVVEPSKLKLAAEEQENMEDSSSLHFRLSRFLQLPKPTKLRCPFCQQKIPSRDLHVPATHTATQAQICSGCLVLCGQILSNEAQRKHSSPG